MKKETIVLASNNNGKMKEIKDILPDYEIISLKEAGIFSNPEETEDTFEGNALLKALDVKKHTEHMVIADDSGLEVFCLKNMPGVYSKRFYSYVYNNNNKNYADSSYIDKLNIRTLLKLMFRVDQVNRNARFVSVIALIKKDGSHVLFRGECKGTILNEPRGKRGFGYDPIFMPACYNLSFAELTDEQKNKVSHRANALTKLKEYLND